MTVSGHPVERQEIYLFGNCNNRKQLLYRRSQTIIAKALDTSVKMKRTLCSLLSLDPSLSLKMNLIRCYVFNVFLNSIVSWTLNQAWLFWDVDLWINDILGRKNHKHLEQPNDNNKTADTPILRTRNARWEVWNAGAYNSKEDFRHWYTTYILSAEYKGLVILLTVSSSFKSKDRNHDWKPS